MIVEKRIFLDETFSCRLQIDETGKLHTNWSPQPPKGLSKKMLDNYLSGRRRAITEALGLCPNLNPPPYDVAEWNIKMQHRK